MNEIERIKELTITLNSARNSYYNNSSSPMSDYEYDNLFDELKSLEDSTGFIMTNSPTRTVGFEVKSALVKKTHSHPMLSLDKTKSVSDLIEFARDKDCILMHKLDGLTISLTYDMGELVSAETRGNGEVGEDITHNARVFENIPLHIDYVGKLEVDGEAHILRSDFDIINSKLPDDQKYKNPRNLASGSVRQLDSSIAASRHLRFSAWKVPTIVAGNSMHERLKRVKELGFDIVDYWTYTNNSSDKDNIDAMIENLKQRAEKDGTPIDGLVMAYDNIDYGESLGMTGHHPRHSIAFKFYDEESISTIREVEFSMGKMGTLTPVAIFDPVDIEGTEVERASLHNISILKDLQVGIGDEVTVYKANAIIPQIRDNLTRSNNLIIPSKCPICNGSTAIVKENDTEVLVCSNNLCKGKLLGKLSHAVSKNALNIDGLSEETLSVLIDKNMVIDIYSIYELKDSKDKLLELDRFGKKKVENLLTEIENSKDIKLENYLYSWSIPLIGRSTSKDISKFVNGDINTLCAMLDSRKMFTSINGFGDEMQKSLSDWWSKFAFDFNDLAQIMRFEKLQVTVTGKDLTGLTFVITGSLNTFENRDACKAELESLGAKVSGSVSAKTSYLINNDSASTSGKNAKAHELGIPIITEEELLKMIG